MKIICDDRFLDSGYAEDNAAMPGRMEAALSGLRPGPGTGWRRRRPPWSSCCWPTTRTTSQRVARDRPRFPWPAWPRAGPSWPPGIAHGGEPAFACVRPPGHHAARDEAWGHCTFSNVALALLVAAPGAAASTAPWSSTSTPTPGTAPARCWPPGPGPRSSTPSPPTRRITWSWSGAPGRYRPHRHPGRVGRLRRLPA